MFDKVEKDRDLEPDKITSIPKAETMPQEKVTLQTTDRSLQTYYTQIAKPSNSINDQYLLASLQKMKKEEQLLIEQKRRLVSAEQNFHDKLIKEMDKKKAAISSLKSEVIDHVNRCKELAIALGEVSR